MTTTAIRAVDPLSSPRGLVLRGGAEGDGRTLHGHFAVVNRWTEINSWHEGHFMERVASGAFTRTFARDRGGMRVLLEHGYDPLLGRKPIAAIRTLREDGIGAYYEADMLDGVPELVLDGLRKGVYGASFRFRIVRDEINHDPPRSEHNPDSLPERTVLEVKVVEFGPVTWGAYPEATSGVRSLTDRFATKERT